MTVKENGNLRPDGVSLSWTPSIPGLKVDLSGAYYWSPGSSTAPRATLSGVLGLGRDVLSVGRGLGGGLVFLRNEMTSADMLGYGTNSNVSTLVPSVTVNTSIPDENGVPLFARNKVSSIEAGVSDSIGASTAGTYTMTPQQIADFLTRYGFVSAAMGPQDELSLFMRSLRSGVGTVGEASEPPVSFLTSRDRNPFSGSIAGWRSSVQWTDPRWPMAPMPPQQPAPEPGGPPGMLQEHLRTYGDY